MKSKWNQAYTDYPYEKGKELGRKIIFTDKNGKFIKEGDLLKIGNRNWEVYYNYERAQYSLRNEEYNYTPWLWSEIVNSNGEVVAEIMES